MASAERAFLADLERRLASGEADQPEVALALLAGRAVALDEDELRGATRRSVQLLATGGDPRRDPDLDGRAVRALAGDLDRPERRQALLEGLEQLLLSAEGLPHVFDRLSRLKADEELAWRWFACTLLAEELSAE